MKFFIVLVAILEATSAGLIEPSYGVPLAPPLQTVTIPESPAILQAPALRLVDGPQQVVAQHQFVAQPQFVQQQQFIQPHIAQAAPVTQVIGNAGPQFIRTVAGPVGHVAAPVPVAAPAPIPAPLAVAPVAAPLAAAPVVAGPVIGSTAVQHHAQDEFGGFNFGYQDENSAKEEVHTPDGVTRGSYSYVDANGLIQRVDYIADPINGFRVAGTNIPVGPGSAPVVVDTPEVVAAKADFQRAFDAASVIEP